MRKHSLIILIAVIAVVIILCLATLSNGDVDKSNLVKRKSDSPYANHGGLYDKKYKKHKKKKNNKQKKNKKQKDHKRRLFIKKRNEDTNDTSKDPDPDLGEVSVKQDENALLKKRQLPVSTGHVNSTKINPGKLSNP